MIRSCAQCRKQREMEKTNLKFLFLVVPQTNSQQSDNVQYIALKSSANEHKKSQVKVVVLCVNVFIERFMLSV